MAVQAKAASAVSQTYPTLQAGDLFGIERASIFGKMTWAQFQANDMSLSGDITLSGTLTVEGNNTFSGVNTFTAVQRIEAADAGIQFKETDQSVGSQASILYSALSNLSVGYYSSDDYTGLTVTHRFERDGGLNAAGSVVTRANGDARYAQLGATNILSGSNRIESTSPTLLFKDTDAVSGQQASFFAVSGGDHILGFYSGDDYTGSATRYRFERDGLLNATDSVVTRDNGDARYAQLGVENIFTTSQTVQGIISTESTSSHIRMRETDAALDEKVWQFRGSGGVLALDTLDDDNAGIEVALYTFERDGNLNNSRSVVVREEGDLRYEAKTFALSAQSTATGAAVGFTSIPAGVNEINIMLDDVSLSGTDNFLVQIGDAGGYETTGYDSTSNQGATSVSSTSGFVIQATSAAHSHIGVMTLRRQTGNKWVATHIVSRGSGLNNAIGAGNKTLSAELDRIQITASGADTIDANGGISINYR